MKYTIAVDGGGSGCRLAAFDSLGTVCATATNGPASLSAGTEQTWLHITRGIQSLAEQLGESADWLPDKLCLGLAGSLQLDRRARFLDLIPSSVTCTLVTDGHAQLLGATAGHAGACLSVGTGSVLHWLDESGHSSMAGGWGFPVGDEGSGAWLGCRLINDYLWHRDGQANNSECPVLFAALEQEIGNTVSALQLWTTSSRPAEFASLVPLIVDAANQQDPVAIALLAAGADQCHRIISIAPKTLPVYVVGGLADIYHSRLLALLGDRLQTPSGDALSGLYALSRSSGTQ